MQTIIAVDAVLDLLDDAAYSTQYWYIAQRVTWNCWGCRAGDAYDQAVQAGSTLADISFVRAHGFSVGTRNAGE